MFESISKTGKNAVIASSILSMAITVIVFTVIALQGLQAVPEAGWSLFSLSWSPGQGQYGILSMIYGTTAVTVVALLIAVPVGVLSAIVISEILPSRYRILVKSSIEILAGIPSIIYGLIGVAVLSVLIGNLFELSTGRTILAGGIILAIMILPIIITLTEDALQNVPSHYREAAKGLGLYKYEVMKDTILPIAKPDIIGGILIGLGRAMGETMAMMLVIGSIDRIPDPFYNILVPGQTITSKLGREITESAFGSLHFNSMIFMGLMLMVAVFIVTMIAQRYIKSGGRLYE